MCERKCANRECASGDEFLTRGLQCSAQGFAGASGCVASGDLLAGMWRAGVCERGRFFFKIVGLRKNIRVTLW